MIVSRMILLMLLAAFSHQAVGEETSPSASDVVVTVLDQQLPSNECEVEEFLWRTFANTKHHKKFIPLRSADWRKAFDEFKWELLAKAKSRKLDVAVPQKCIEIVYGLAGRNAYVPISAHRSTMDGKMVWIIVVTWERELSRDQQRFGHIRIYVLDAETFKIVGAKSCC